MHPAAALVAAGGIRPTGSSGSGAGAGTGHNPSNFSRTLPGPGRPIPLSNHSSSGANEHSVDKRLSLLHEIAQLQDENATLRIQIRRMTEEHERVARSYADLSRRHEELQSHFQVSESLVSTLREEQADLRTEVQVLLSTSHQGSTIVAQQKLHEELRQKVQTLETELNEAKQKLKSKGAHITRLEDLAARAIRHLVQLIVDRGLGSVPMSSITGNVTNDGIPFGVRATRQGTEEERLERLKHELERAEATDLAIAERLRGSVTLAATQSDTSDVTAAAAQLPSISTHSAEVAKERIAATKRLEFLKIHLDAVRSDIAQTHSDARNRALQLGAELESACNAHIASCMARLALREQLDRALSKLKQSQADYESVSAELTQARKELHELRLLRQQDQAALKLASERDADAELERKRAEAMVGSLKEELAKLRAERQPLLQATYDLRHQLDTRESLQRQQTEESARLLEELAELRHERTREAQAAEAARAAAADANAQVEALKAELEAAKASITHLQSDLARLSDLQAMMKSSTSSSSAASSPTRGDRSTSVDVSSTVSSPKSGASSFSDGVKSPKSQQPIVAIKPEGGTDGEPAAEHEGSLDTEAINPDASPEAPCSDDGPLDGQLDVDSRDVTAALRMDIERLELALKRKDIAIGSLQVEVSALQEESASALADLATAQAEVVQLKKQLRVKEKLLVQAQASQAQAMSSSLSQASRLLPKPGLAPAPPKLAHAPLRPGMPPAQAQPQLETNQSENPSDLANTVLKLQEQVQSLQQQLEAKQQKCSDDYLEVLATRERTLLEEVESFLRKAAGVVKACTSKVISQHSVEDVSLTLKSMAKTLEQLYQPQGQVSAGTTSVGGGAAGAPQSSSTSTSTSTQPSGSPNPNSSAPAITVLKMPTREAKLLARTLADFALICETSLRSCADHAIKWSPEMAELRQAVADFEKQAYPAKIEELQAQTAQLKAALKSTTEQLNVALAQLRIYEDARAASMTGGQAAAAQSQSVTGPLRAQVLALRQAHQSASAQLAEVTTRLHQTEQALKQAREEQLQLREACRRLTESEAASFVQLSALRESLALSRADAARLPAVITKLRAALAASQAANISLGAEVSGLRSQLAHLRLLYGAADTSRAADSGSAHTDSHQLHIQAIQGINAIADAVNALISGLAAANNLEKAQQQLQQHQQTSSSNSISVIEAVAAKAANAFDMFEIALSSVERDFPTSQHLALALMSFAQLVRTYPESLARVTTNVAWVNKELTQVESLSLGEAVHVITTLASSIEARIGGGSNQSASGSDSGSNSAEADTVHIALTPLMEGLHQLLVRLRSVYEWSDKMNSVLRQTLQLRERVLLLAAASGGATLPAPSSGKSSMIVPTEDSVAMNSIAATAIAAAAAGGHIDTTFLHALRTGLDGIASNHPTARPLASSLVSLASLFEAALQTVGQVDKGIENALIESAVAQPGDVQWLTGLRDRCFKPVLARMQNNQNPPVPDVSGRSGDSGDARSESSSDGYVLVQSKSLANSDLVDPMFQGTVTRLMKLVSKHSALVEGLQALGSVLKSSHSTLNSLFVDQPSSTNSGQGTNTSEAIRTAYQELANNLSLAAASPPLSDPDLAPITRRVASLSAYAAELAEHRELAGLLNRSLKDLVLGIKQVNRQLAATEIGPLMLAKEPSPSEPSGQLQRIKSVASTASSTHSAADSRFTFAQAPTTPKSVASYSSQPASARGPGVTFAFPITSQSQAVSTPGSSQNANMNSAVTANLTAAIETIRNALMRLASVHSPITPILSGFTTFLLQLRALRTELSLSPRRAEVIALQASLAELRQQYAELLSQTRAQTRLISEAISLRQKLKRHLGAAFTPAGAGEGVLVTRVTPGSAADVAGLRSQDIIQAVNDIVIADMNDFQTAVETYLGVGQSAALLVRRGGGAFPIHLRVGVQGLSLSQLEFIEMLVRMGSIDWSRSTLRQPRFEQLLEPVPVLESADNRKPSTHGSTPVKSLTVNTSSDDGEDESTDSASSPGESTPGSSSAPAGQGTPTPLLKVKSLRVDVSDPADGPGSSESQE